jgi:hypothetical protein
MFQIGTLWHVQHVAISSILVNSLKAKHIMSFFNEIFVFWASEFLLLYKEKISVERISINLHLVEFEHFLKGLWFSGVESFYITLFTSKNATKRNICQQSFHEKLET